MRRRQFLQSAVAAGALAAGPARGAGAAPDPSRHFTIDCQSHLFVPEMVALMERRKQPPYAYRKDGQTYVVVGEWHRRLMPNHTDVQAKLAAMDAAGIDLTALSINDPGPELFGSEGDAVAHLVNDFIGGIAAEHPQRFFGLMVLPLQDMNASLQELDRCSTRLRMKGILLYSNLNGAFPDEPRFRPLFAEAERRGLPILLHPAYPVTWDQTKGYELTGGLGLMFDTTIALARLILSGLLDRHPRLKLVCPHVGGTLPYLIGRLDHQTQVLKRGAQHITRPPSEYLKQIWFDCVSPLPAAIRYGIEMIGVDRMLYASDHPWVDPKLIAGCVKELKLGAAGERKVFGENAKRLFNL